MWRLTMFQSKKNKKLCCIALIINSEQPYYLTFLIILITQINRSDRYNLYNLFKVDIF